MFLDLSGWNDFLSQNKNVESIGKEYNPSRSINLPMWTEVLKHPTAGLMNAAYDPKVTCMQTMVSEESRRRQTGCKRETFVTDDLNGGKSVFADGDLQPLARSDIQNIAMQVLCCMRHLSQCMHCMCFICSERVQE
jgi:hypothetical protein